MLSTDLKSIETLDCCIYCIYEDSSISRKRGCPPTAPKELINHATTAVCDSYLGAKSLIDAFRPGPSCLLSSGNGHACQPQKSGSTRDHSG